MEKTRIEWADSTWNPVSGCYHDCPYCYARTTANRFKGCNIAPEGVADTKIVELKSRLTVTNKDGVTRGAAYPYGFTPTLHEYRLDDPKKKGLGKTIFVCSMADLFGDWVPDEWIEKVFDACKAAEGHRYLFLTKNPARYEELALEGKLPKEDNFWYGSTITDPFMPAFWAEDYHTFISVEPIQEPFGSADTPGGLADKVEWAIFGAETGNRPEKIIPEKSWFEGVVNDFRERGKPVFMKDSLASIWGGPLLTETPWD